MSQKIGNVRRIVLSIAIERNNDATSRLVKTCPQRGGLAPVLRERDNPHRRIRLCREVVKDGSGSIAAPVVNAQAFGRAI